MTRAEFMSALEEIRSIMERGNNVESAKHIVPTADEFPTFLIVPNRWRKGKTPSELEQIAKNICASKGVNYEEALNAFRQMMPK